VALKRGPLIYCAEEIDQGSVPLASIRFPRTATASAVPRSDLFSGIVAVTSDAALKVVAQGGALYQTEPFATEPAVLTAIPYYLWNNRGPNRMLVWLPEG